MRDLIKIFLAVLQLTFFLPASAQNDFCNIKNTSFKAGEKLIFKVYYNASFIWVNAGTAAFSVEPEEMNGRDVYHVSGVGRTAKSYEWFYKVNDKYETYLDKETLLPHRFIRNVNEGGFRINQDITFSQAKRQAVSDRKVYSIPQCTQDVLSAIYFARNIDYSKYKPGDKIPFNMFLDDKVYSLYIKYVGKETVKTKFGVYNSIKIVPLLIEGTLFTGGEKMTVWVSDDKNHIPLRISSPILVGSIKVDLMDYQNLRNPFDGLVKQ